MRRTLALSALLAWTMMQVPLVACESACGTTMTAVVLVSAHTCHDEESDSHQEHCLQGRDDAPTESEQDHEDGTHALIQAASSVVPVADVLPVASCATLAATSDSLAHVPGPLETWVMACGDCGPPPAADPVSTSDRLLV